MANLRQLELRLQFSLAVAAFHSRWSAGFDAVAEACSVTTELSVEEAKAEADARHEGFLATGGYKVSEVQKGGYSDAYQREELDPAARWTETPARRCAPPVAREVAYA